MYRVSTTLLALLAIGSSLQAQEKAGGRKAVDAAVPASKSWYGTLSVAYREASESTARSFLAFNAARFDLDAVLELALDNVADNGIGRSFRFRQTASGIPVYGAEVKVQFNRRFEVVAVNSSYVRGVRLTDAAPRLTGERARQIIAAGTPAGEDDEEEQGGATLYVYATSGAPVLVWEVTRHKGGPSWKALVHAGNGGYVQRPYDDNRYVDGTGRVFQVNAVVAAQNNTLRDNRDSASAVPALAYSTVALLGLTGQGYLDGPYASSAASKVRAFSASNSFLYDRSSNGFSEAMGYFHIDYAQRYIQSRGFVNTNSVNNRQQVFAVDRLKQDNAFYSPSTKQISLGTGGVDDAEDGEVIWHEYGHSIQDNQVPGFGVGNEAGAMGEGFGDYLAGTLSDHFSQFQLLCVGDWDATSYSSKNPPCLRRLDSTKHYPEAIVNQVHADGEIWSAALWQIRSAIGAAKADKLILQHHFIVAKDAKFNAAANALVTTAANTGFTSAEVNTIRTILQNRGFTVTV